MPVHVRPLANALPLSLLLSCALSAQTPATALRVVDERGAPVPHAVLDVGGGRARIADDSGRITMHFDGDSATVHVRRMGFAPYFGRVPRALGGEVTVTLARVAQPLAPVTVEMARDQSPLERTGYYDRVNRVQRGAYNAEFVTPEELDSRVMTRLSDAFRGRRFIKVIPAGRRGAVLQGRAGCAITVLLDGRPVAPLGGSVDALAPNGKDPTLTKDGAKGPPKPPLVGSGGGTFYPSAGIDIDELVNIGSVAAIEMYASANMAPVELAPVSSYCGVVAIWTGARR